jgi:hypothetical protein
MARRARPASAGKAKRTIQASPAETPGSPGTGWKGLRPATRITLLLAAAGIWLGGVMLRGGFIGHPEVVYDTDSAFHDRMIRHLLDTGEYPAADPFFIQTPLRAPARDMYPTLYHRTAVGWTRCAAWLTGSSPTDSLLFFGALMGSLLIPLAGWAAWRACRMPLETLLVMVLTAISTPAILRGSYAILRPETLGAAMAVLATLLFWTWREDLRPGQRRLLACGLAVVNFVGAGAWRPFPLLAAIGGVTVLAAAFGRGRRPRLAGPILGATAGVTAAGLMFEFYRTGGFPHLAFLLPIPLLLGIQWVLASQPVLTLAGRLRPCWRWCLLAGLAAVEILAAHAIIPMLRIRVDTWLDPGRTPLNAANLYGRMVAELQPFSLVNAFEPYRHFILPAVLFALLLTWLVRPSARPQTAFLPLTAAALGLMGVLMIRFEYVALPFALALIGTNLRPALAAWLPPRWRRAGALAGLLVICLPVAVVQAAIDLNNLAPPARREVNRRQCYEWMRACLPPGTPVAASWSHGYELQRYAGCATVTDGFLESALNRDRLLELYGILFSEDEHRLAEFCRPLGVRYLVLDRYDLLPEARVLQLPWESWLAVSGNPDETVRMDVLPEGRWLVYIRLLSGYPTAYFRPVHIAGNYVVLEFQEPA